MRGNTDTNLFTEHASQRKQIVAKHQDNDYLETKSRVDI